MAIILGDPPEMGLPRWKNTVTFVTLLRKRLLPVTHLPMSRTNIIGHHMALHSTISGKDVSIRQQTGQYLGDSHSSSWASTSVSIRAELDETTSRQLLDIVTFDPPYISVSSVLCEERQSIRTLCIRDRRGGSIQGQLNPAV